MQKREARKEGLEREAGGRIASYSLSLPVISGIRDWEWCRSSDPVLTGALFCRGIMESWHRGIVEPWHRGIVADEGLDSLDSLDSRVTVLVQSLH